MSAGVCGKRVGCFEENFVSSSSVKRSRFSSFGSPVRAPESVSGGSEDTLSVLIRMFPNLNPELVENILRTHNNKIEDAIQSLHALTLGDVTANNEPQCLNSITIGNCTSVPGCQIVEQKVEDIHDKESISDSGNTIEGSKWVDMFVHEMMSATDLDDARGRASRILEAFERNIIGNARVSDELEHASLKEHLQTLLRDNQILKRAVAIQHEHNSEQEVKTREVQQLKHVICQYQEQVRSLELTNYSLKLHLQRAQGSSSIPGQFHPDIC